MGMETQKILPLTLVYNCTHLAAPLIRASDLVKYEFVITVVISATMLMAAALAMDYYIKFLPGQQAEQGVPQTADGHSS